MALNGRGPKFLKHTVFSFNVLLCVSGLILTSITGFLALDSLFLAIDPDRMNGPGSVLVFLIAVGGLMIIVGALGCFGSFRESEVLLLAFLTCLLVLFACEFYSCSWVCRNGQTLTKETTEFYDSLYDMAEDRSSIASNARWAFHGMLNCCGKTLTANLTRDVCPQTGSQRAVSCHDRAKDLVRNPIYFITCYSVVFSVIAFEMICGLELCFLCTTEVEPEVRQRGDDPGPGPRPRDV